MASATGTLEFRGVGGEYRFVVQGTDELDAVDEFLQSVITTANIVGSRVYNGWASETVSITEGTVWVTYRWVRNNASDETTFGAPAGGRVADVIYEVLAWVQGKSYAPATSVAAALVPLLDIGKTTMTNGTILGAGRYGPARGYYEREQG